MKYTVFDIKGFHDYRRWLKDDKSKYEKINDLIQSIQRDGPLKGKGKPEVLKGSYKGNYSRRIDDKNRLIYQYYEDKKTGDSNTLILGCKEHYSGSENTEKQKCLAILNVLE